MSTGAMIGGGMGILGGEMSGWAAYLAKQEMLRQFHREMERQAAFRTQAQEQFNRRVEGVRGATQQMEGAKQERLSAMANLAKVPMTVSSSTPGPTTRDAAFADLLGQAKARLAAYGDYLTQQALQSQATQRALGQISNFAAGTSGVFPYRMYRAQHSQDALANMGQSIQNMGKFGGTMYDSYAGPQWNPQQRQMGQQYMDTTREGSGGWIGMP